MIATAYFTLVCFVGCTTQLWLYYIAKARVEYASATVQRRALIIANSHRATAAIRTACFTIGFVFGLYSLITRQGPDSLYGVAAGGVLSMCFTGFAINGIIELRARSNLLHDMGVEPTLNGAPT